ncbi:tripartite tricarboxylate transporter substrate binding protein [Azospirillum sp. TSO22-1]|uniref:Bug family tripartite tricarboxylate transporter substrate binding protein n=1 Tax=Azospirillum sp. TSO22-1 TaxID=716789 RepID=UPI000D6142C5|nr:tripartite tricarboxylate transporter substrate binding protein [Azospirillum sp. TSO22-1]PWC44937.1 hypothetical protein TSO221_16440 [Azospirillum sp. TSO22-1]
MTPTKALGAAVLSALLALSAPAAADTYPSKPIRYVVPFPPGATSDNVSRILAQRLSEITGQPVVVENKPGAGTALGAELVAKAEPDGYTLLNVTNATLAAIPHLVKLSYDPETAFVPLALSGDSYSYIAVNPEVPGKDLKEFIAYAQKNPGKLNFGTAGNGSLGHIYGELLKLRTGIDLVHVPYKGSAAALNDAVTGQVQVVLDPAALPLAKAGKLRALATLNAQRSPALPDLPTIHEAGVPNWNARLWFGVAAPAKTPPEVVAFLNATFNKILAEPETVEKLRALNLEPRRLSVDEIRAVVREDFATFGEIIKAANIKSE